MHPQPITPCDPRALGNLKHGLTGRIFFFSETDQSAYDELYRGLKEALAPEGRVEEEILKDLADDRWRMSRATERRTCGPICARSPIHWWRLCPRPNSR